MIDPLQWRITREFGAPPIPGVDPNLHTGVDLAPPGPGYPVPSIRPGTVARDDDDPRGAEGVSVAVRYDDGGLATFAHLARNVVREGQRLDGADVIGNVGATGLATGAHLHLEVRDATDRLRDPLGYFRGATSPALGASADCPPGYYRNIFGQCVKGAGGFVPDVGELPTAPGAGEPFPEGGGLDIPGAITAGVESLKSGAAQLALTAGVLGFSAVLAYQGIRKAATG